MKYTSTKLAFALSFLFQISFSQQMPIDFSDASDNFNVWGGSSFSTRLSPTDSGNTVGEFSKSNSALEQGHYIDLIRSINLDENNTITLSFYAFDPNLHTIVVKLENGVNPNIELSVTDSSQNAWKTLSFDFSTIGGSSTYNRLTIRIDDSSTVPGTFLIDDISDGSIPIDPNALDVEYTDLVWSDEFDTSGLQNPIDATKWHHQTQIPAGGSWYNGEEQHYTNRTANSFVENGYLNIRAKKETFSDQGHTKQYTSARLNSKFAFTYGRVDVRAKLPSGDGTWPAIWTLGKDINEDGAYWDNQGFDTSYWPACGEIDIMEHGLGAVNHTSSALHTLSSSGGTVNTASQVIADVASNFHIYSLHWSPNQITFLVDNIAYYTYNPLTKDANTWPFDSDQYLLLNVAMGGVSGTIDPGFIQSSMVIDYVRVYQNNNLSLNEHFTNSFKVYPNPASNVININSSNKVDKIKIYDVLGQLMIDINKPIKTIDVSNLNTGLYFLNIQSENSTVIKKFSIK